MGDLFQWRDLACAWTVAALASGLVGCLANTDGLGKGSGKESGGCYEGLLCDEGLQCVLGVCVPLDDEGGDTMGEATMDDEADGADGADEAGEADGADEADGTSGAEGSATGAGDSTGGESSTEGEATSAEDSDMGGPVCGDAIIDPGEVCDGANLGGDNCTTQGYDAGVLGCAPDCSALDLSACMNTPQPGSGLYAHCLQSPECPGLDGCANFMSEDERSPSDGFCTNFCLFDSDCVAQVGGTATSVCNDEFTPFCQLDCSEGKTCPAGMICAELDVGTICI